MPDGTIAIATDPPAANLTASAQTADDRFLLRGIKEGGKDSQDRLITRVYALRPGNYAVYLAGDVRIEYSDNCMQEAEQRAAVVSAVGKSRAEITALLVGWGPERRRVYDTKIAMALELALEKKPEEARTMIDDARAQLIQERAAAGRLQYVGFAAFWCLPLMLALWAGEWLSGRPAPGDDLLMAGQAGLLGAAFSIALAVRSRTVALDTDRWSNASDGLLRLVIGVLSGSVLLLLLSSGLMPKLALGNGPFFNWAEISWKGVLLIGFIAGFLERLVPDLLDKAAAMPVGAPSSQHA